MNPDELFEFLQRTADGEDINKVFAEAIEKLEPCTCDV
jgi:hypothetical protein